METLLEDIVSTPSVPGSVSTGLAKSKSSSSAASANSSAPAPAAKYYRSKTVPSPETKLPKLVLLKFSSDWFPAFLSEPELEPDIGFG